MTSQKIQEESVKSGISIMQNLAALASTTMGGQIKSVINSPDFSEAIKKSGAALMSDPQFQRSIKNIFSSIASELINTDEIKLVFIEVIKASIENLVSSEIVRNLLINVSTTVVNSVAETFEKQTTQVKSFVDDRIGASIKEALIDVMPLLEETMENSLKEATSRIEPSIIINADAKIKLNNE